MANEDIKDINEELPTVTLADENGNQSEYFLADTIIYEGKNYAAFVPADENDTDVLFLEIEDENEETGEATLSGVEGNEILNKLFELFKEKNSEYFNFS